MEIKDIQKLIDADALAMDKVIKIHDEKSATIKSIKLEKEHLAKESWQAIYDKVESTKLELDHKIKEDETTNRAEFEKQAKEVETKFNQNHDKWLNDIFNACIK